MEGGVAREGGGRRRREWRKEIKRKDGGGMRNEETRNQTGREREEEGGGGWVAGGVAHCEPDLLAFASQPRRYAHLVRSYRHGMHGRETGVSMN